MKALVFLVSGIVLMLYVSVHLVVVFPQAHWYFHTTLGFLHYLFVNFLLATTCYSYYCIVSTGPGEVSLLWVPQGFTDEELEAAKTSEPHKKRSHAGLLPRPRYCSKCCVYKPPRSHHCSVCDRCVPRMDHHCPWVNNCVGNGNHKLFVVFLFWGVTGILYGLFLLLFRLILMFRAIFMDAPITVTPIQGAIIGINLVTLLPIVLGMISLFCWQMNLAGLNTTTIEFHEKQWQQRYFRTKRRKYRWPYDFGVCENFRVFFGYSYLTWFLPVPPKNLGDGMNYPMALSEETIEQMREWEREDEEAARRSEMEEVHEVDAPPAPTSLPDAVLSSETIRSRGEDRILSV